MPPVPIYCAESDPQLKRRRATNGRWRWSPMAANADFSSGACTKFSHPPRNRHSSRSLASRTGYNTAPASLIYPRDPQVMTKCLACIFLLACFTSTAIAGMTADSKQVAEVENIYADLSDAFSIITTIDSGLFTSYRGKERAAWAQEYREKRKQFSERLANLPARGLSAE